MSLLTSLPKKLVKVVQKTGWLLVVFCAGLMMASKLSFAQPQVDWQRFYQVTEQTYGAPSVRNAKRWQEMLENVKQMPGDLEKLKAVNAFFDRFIRYRLDDKNYGVKDYWASLLETLARGTGDCEDYAIAKYITLLLAGVEDTKLRLIYVKAQMGGPRSPIFEAHMVLGYYETPSAEPLILDSLVSLVQKASMRPDLKPVFSFNSEGLWAGLSTRSSSKPTARLSRWQKVLEQTVREGIRIQ